MFIDIQDNILLVWGTILVLLAYLTCTQASHHCCSLGGYCRCSNLYVCAPCKDRAQLCNTLTPPGAHDAQGHVTATLAQDPGITTEIVSLTDYAADKVKHTCINIVRPYLRHRSMYPTTSNVSYLHIDHNIYMSPRFHHEFPKPAQNILHVLGPINTHQAMSQPSLSNA